MAIQIISATHRGLDGVLINVEVDITRGIPIFNIVGLPDTSIKESKERVRMAIINSGYEFPLGRITINLAPADVKKIGSLLDLPIALGILMASGQIEEKSLNDYIIFGELSLNGELKGVKGAIPIIFEGERNVDNTQMFGEVCIQFTDSTTEYIASYVNNIPTTEAGTHESGFKTGMTRAFKEWAKKLGLVKEKDKEFEGDDLREGMTAIVRIKITNPVFEGQTKTKLGSSEAYTMMNDLSYTKFCEWIEDNKEVATSLINNALAAAQRREKIKKINEAEKKKVGKGTAPLAGKIAVCTLKDKSVNEFIVVEGDSAGGSAKQARDRRFQSIMPSKGKIMNTEKQKLENVLASEELKIFNTAIGTGTLDNYKEEDLKYDKIIIMSDADVDGYHSATRC